jgi:hypothetical protein
MTIDDKRTEEQKKTHTLAVVARDSFLSGWGRAEFGTSRVAFAVNPAEVNIDRVFNWVKDRPEMKNASVIDLTTYKPARGTVHFDIVVIHPQHPAAKH